MATPTVRANRYHYSELPAPDPGDRGMVAWATYLREAARFLAEGREGQHVLIFGNEVVGFWPDDDSAMKEVYRNPTRRPYLVKQVLEWEPIHRSGVLKICPGSLTPFPRTG